MPDLADQIDAALGAAPPGVPSLDATLALGRRALVRRRLAYGVGATATALVIGGTAWAVTPGDDGPGRSDAPGFGNRATPTTAVAPSTPPDPPRQTAWAGNQAAILDEAGHVQVRPGWHVVEDVSGPGMIGVAVAKGDRRQWFLFGDAMTIGSLHAPQPGYDSFQDWVDVNAPLLEGDDPGGQGDGGQGDAAEWPGVPRDDLVHFVPRFMSSARGLAPVSDDVVIVDQRFNPDLGPSFADPSRTGAAEVRKDGATWYVVARRPDDYIAVRATVAETDYGVDDLDEFLAFARERYAEGGGGLL